jgi:hypothetical protein
MTTAHDKLRRHEDSLSRLAIDEWDALTAERDEYRTALGNLLARIFRDGGQHAAAVGDMLAAQQADASVVAMLDAVAERDAALAQLAEAKAAAAADHAVAEAADALPAGLDASPCTRGSWRTDMAEEAEAGDAGAIAMQRLLAALDARPKP